MENYPKPEFKIPSLAEMVEWMFDGKRNDYLVFRLNLGGTE